MKDSKRKMDYEDIWNMTKTILLMVAFVVPFMITMTNNWGFFFPEFDEWQEQNNIENQKRSDMIDGYDKIARNSVDCDELKQVQLDLLGYGVNVDSWIPRMSDEAMKVAQERYALLC